MPPQQPRSSRWVFTINNYDQEDELRLSELDAKYVIYGREIGESGTKHLQGFCIFRNAKRFNGVRDLIGRRAHCEPARGTSKQAADYCKKDGDYCEYGEAPTQQGKRNDWEEFTNWCSGLDGPPSQRELILRWPGLYARYKKALSEIAQVHAPRLQLQTGSPREGWQQQLEECIEEEPVSERSIDFYVDEQGNSGKSWMVKYLLDKYPDDAQIIRPGKEMDMCYEVDESKWIFLFDLPRSKMETFQYSILECLKDRIVFSGKYESRNKILRRVPRVIVFCNESPNMEKLSSDRYNIINI